MKKILKVSSVVGLIAVVAILFYYFNPKQKSDTEIVRIGSFFEAVDYAPYLIAKNKGWFEKALKEENVKVEYAQFQSLPPLNEAFATDKIDIIFEAEPPAIVGKAAGIDIKIMDIS